MGANAWLLAVTAALLVGFSKTGVPGMGILIVPLMAAIFPARLSVGALLPMLVAGDMVCLFYYRRHACWDRLLGLFPFILPGMGAGWLLLSRIDDARLKPLLGGLIISLMILDGLRRYLRWESMPRQWWFAGIMGLLAGFTTTVGNAAGPVMTIYLLSCGLDKEEYLGTGAWYFAAVNLLKFPIYFFSLGIITSQTLHFNLLMLPVILLGAFVGIKALPVIPQTAFNRVVLGLAFLSAVRMLF